MASSDIFQTVRELVLATDTVHAPQNAHGLATQTTALRGTVAINEIPLPIAPASPILELPLEPEGKPAARTEGSFSLAELGKISVDQAVGFFSKAGEALADAALALNGANHRTRHLCLMGVERALESISGIIQWSYSQSTARAIDALKFLKSDPQFLQVRGSGPDGMLTAAEMREVQNLTGAIVYYKNPYNPKKAGHICITTGDGGAISDFKQKSIQVYSKPVSGYYVFLPLDRDPAQGG